MKYKELLRVAELLEPVIRNWADFHNLLFAQPNGILCRAFPLRADREKFVASPEYKAIGALGAKIGARSGLVAGAVPTLLLNLESQ